MSDGDGSLSPAACPTPSSEHNHEERVLHPPCRRLRLYFSCVVWRLALSLQDERWMSQTECGHSGDLVASSHMADFFLMSPEGKSGKRRRP